MDSGGDLPLQIDRLQELAIAGILDPTIIQHRLIRIIQEQQRLITRNQARIEQHQERIEGLEKELFDKCYDLRNRVAAMENKGEVHAQRLREDPRSAHP